MTLAIWWLALSLFGQTPEKLSVTELTGSTQTNYPVNKNIAFADGEIVNYPQAIVNGGPVATQANCKNRYSSGYAKLCRVAFVISSLTASSTASITFQNQASANDSALSKAAMLAFDFDAETRLTNVSTVTASARTMLNADAYTCWTCGPIANTVIIADHATNAYDMGFDGNNGFRPIFEVTFWPAPVNKVDIYIIGENGAKTTAVQNITYSLELRTGFSAPSTVYTKASRDWSAKTRWIKEFWIGGAPGAVSYKHNLSELRRTNLVPYYDSSRTVSATAGCSTWTSASKDLGDAGSWTKNMPQAGARPDIGPYPGWNANWLFTGGGSANCLEEKALGNADLAANWPYHLREASTAVNRPYLLGDSGNTAMGRWVSLAARPTLSFQTTSGTTAQDLATVIGSPSANGWIIDPAHMPSPWYIPYVLTGRHWYYEETIAQAHHVIAQAYKDVNHRGPATATGGIPAAYWASCNHSQTRGFAWDMRTRVEAAAITVDGSPERTYIEDQIANCFAIDEGKLNLTSSPRNGNGPWNYGRNTWAAQTAAASVGGTALSQIPTLPVFSRGDATFRQCEYGINGQNQSPNSCSANCLTDTPACYIDRATSLYEHDYLMYALGRARELGYATPLTDYIAGLYVQILTNAAFNPYIVENGRFPTTKTAAHGSGYIATWAEAKNGFTPSWRAQTSFNTIAQSDGYAAYAWAAVTMVRGTAISGSDTAYTWMKTNYYDVQTAIDPKWAMLERDGSSDPPPPPPPTGGSARVKVRGAATVRGTIR